MTTATPKTYAKYRNDIRTGDLILFESKDIISRMVSWKTKSTITHAAMAFWLEQPLHNQRLFILESVLTGLSLNYLSNRVAWYLPHGDMYWHKMMPKFQEMGPTAANVLLKNVGKFYDFRDLIVQSITRVTINPSKLFCSEAVAFAWKDIAGLPDDFLAPYPSEMTGERLGVYEKEGIKIT